MKPAGAVGDAAQRRLHRLLRSADFTLSNCKRGVSIILSRPGRTIQFVRDARACAIEIERGLLAVRFAGVVVDLACDHSSFLRTISRQPGLVPKFILSQHSKPS